MEDRQAEKKGGYKRRLRKVGYGRNRTKAGNGGVEKGKKNVTFTATNS